MSHVSPIIAGVRALPTAQDSRSTAVHAGMRFFAVLLTMSVGLGCGGTNSRNARSPDEENSEEVESESDNSERPAEASEDGDEPRSGEGSRPAKKRRPKRRRQVEQVAEAEAPPIYRKPLPPPPMEPPPPEEPAPAPALSETTDQGDNSLEAEARKRCRWKNVPPYRPDWANSISPPLAQQRKITMKPICPYGTPPAVLRVAREIAVQKTKLKSR
jgi:hypothetical protein